MGSKKISVRKQTNFVEPHVCWLFDKRCPLFPLFFLSFFLPFFLFLDLFYTFPYVRSSVVLGGAYPSSWTLLGRAQLGTERFFRDSNFIDGEWRSSASGKRIDVVNPANKKVKLYPKLCLCIRNIQLIRDWKLSFEIPIFWGNKAFHLIFQLLPFYIV